MGLHVTLDRHQTVVLEEVQEQLGFACSNRGRKLTELLRAKEKCLDACNNLRDDFPK